MKHNELWATLLQVVWTSEGWAIWTLHNGAADHNRTIQNFINRLLYLVVCDGLTQDWPETCEHIVC